MKSLIFVSMLLLAFCSANAQFTMAGKIEFERKSNVHQQLEDMASDDEEQGGESWFSKMKNQIPKYMSNYFDYSFTPTSAIYKPGKEVENPFKMFGQSPASDNTVFTDFKTDKVTASKQVFEQKFLVQDSMRQLTWKLSDEIRTIANFKCRKAVGKYCDSVYVVAFYTEDIPVSGGPEMFAGLPGMILEVAIPRLHTTWIATKVDIITPKPEDLKAPEKGKKVSQQELYSQVQSSTEKWGKFAQRSLWWTML
jgi:GLPGLI family protein